MPNPNLVPYEYPPGQSGNPKGRPKGSKSITDMLRQYLDRDIETPYEVTDPETGEKIDKMKAKEFIALNLIGKAIKGAKEETQLKATELIQDRIEGKAKQVIETKGPVDPTKDAYENIKKIALREGVTVDELCERENIDVSEFGKE